MLICINYYSQLFSQIAIDTNTSNTINEELLIQIFVNNNNIGDFIVYKNKHYLYIPIKDILLKLRIKVENTSEDSLIFKAFDFNEKVLISFNFKERVIKTKDTSIILNNSQFTIINNKVFLECSLFATLINAKVNLLHNFLELIIVTDYSLPFELLSKIEGYNKNKIQNETEDLIIYPKEEKNYNGINIDYYSALYRNFHANNFSYSGNFVSGMRIFNGDLNSNLYIYNYNKFVFNNSSISYKYVNNYKLLKQFIIGDFNISNDDNVYGIKISNELPYKKKKFVDLKVKLPKDNNFYEEIFYSGENIKRDEDSVLLTLKYGLNYIEQNNYDYFGFNKKSELAIYIPEDMLRVNEFEYTFSIGRLKYYGNSPIIDFKSTYGLNNRLTLSGGFYFISEKSNNMLYPFFVGYFRFKNNLIIKPEIKINDIYGLKISYYHSNSYSGELSYKHHFNDSFLNRTNLKNEFNLNLNLLQKIGQLNSSLNLNYFIREFNNSYFYSNLICNISLNWKNVILGFNYSTSLIKNSFNHYLYGNYSIRLSGTLLNYFLSINSTYDNYFKKISNTSANINKKITKDINISLNLNKNYISNKNEFIFSLRYTPSFSNISIDYYNGNNSFATINTYGNICYSPEDNLFLYSSNSTFNRGNAMFQYFIDNNQNGWFDENELLLEKPVIFSNYFGEIKRERNNLIYTNIEGYDTTCILSESNKKYKFIPLPNTIQKYYIPVVSISEINGKIIQDTKENISVNKFRLKMKDSLGNVYYPELFSNGEYSFKNIKNGKYEIILSVQELNYKVTPERISLNISHKSDINIYDDINFIVTTKEIDKKEIVALDSISNYQKDSIESFTMIISNPPKRKRFYLYELEQKKNSVNYYFSLLSKYILNTKEIKIILEINTDNTGNFFDKMLRCNYILRKVKELFEKHGIYTKEVIEKISLDLYPVASHLSPESKKLNNNVLIKIIKKK